MEVVNMDEVFKLCNHCGELFFKESIASNGKCKCCNDGHTRYELNEISDIDD